MRPWPTSSRRTRAVPSSVPTSRASRGDASCSSATPSDDGALLPRRRRTLLRNGAHRRRASARASARRRQARYATAWACGRRGSADRWMRHATDDAAPANNGTATHHPAGGKYAGAAGGSGGRAGARARRGCSVGVQVKRRRQATNRQCTSSHAPPIRKPVRRCTIAPSNSVCTRNGGRGGGGSHNTGQWRAAGGGGGRTGFRCKHGEPEGAALVARCSPSAPAGQICRIAGVDRRVDVGYGAARAVLQHTAPAQHEPVRRSLLHHAGRGHGAELV